MNTSLKTCFKCGHEQPLSEFYKHKMMADGHLNKCKSCAKIDYLIYREKNIDRIREYDKSRAMLPHRVALRAKYSKTEKGKESFRKSSKKYNANNKEKRRAIKASAENFRQASKLLRTPPWLTKEDRARINTKYAEARWMTQRTGVKHHVDHICPILGEMVCGLHVPWNLRVIPARENIKKSNSLIKE